MDVDELSSKLVERKQMEKKVDGGGDLIEVHQRLEKMLTSLVTSKKMLARVG